MALSHKISLLFIYGALLTTTSFGAGDLSTALYPWNLSIGGYYTNGDYASGQTSHSAFTYLALDKHNKDQFSVSYESLAIKSDSSSYSQFNIFVKDKFWIKSYLQIGTIFGLMKSKPLVTILTDTTWQTSGNNIFSIAEDSYEDYHHGWVAGILLLGDFPWFGYSLSALQSQYNYYSDLQYNIIYPPDSTGFIPYPGDTLSGNYQYYARQDITQLSYTLSKQLGSHIVSLGQLFLSINDELLQSFHGSWRWWPAPALELNLNAAIGKSRYTIDPDLLILNNNPDILRRLAGLKLSYRFATNWTITGLLSHHKYDVVDLEFDQVENTSYTVDYFSMGIQGRF